LFFEKNLELKYAVNHTLPKLCHYKNICFSAGINSNAGCCCFILFYAIHRQIKSGIGCNALMTGITTG